MEKRKVFARDYLCRAATEGEVSEEALEYFGRCEETEEAYQGEDLT